ALPPVFVSGPSPLWLPPALDGPTQNFFSPLRPRLPLVPLRFGDAPLPPSPPHLLDTLHRHDAKATFFLIGDRARRHPNLVAAIRAAGDEIGNHYSNNVPTLGHSDAKFLRNLDQTETALSLDKKPALVRPPGAVASLGQINIARQRGYTCVLGCAYPHDPMHPPVWYIRWLIEKNLIPGAIIVLHDGISNPSRSLQALPHILEAGQRKGLRFVSISELLRAAGAESGESWPF